DPRVLRGARGRARDPRVRAGAHRRRRHDDRRHQRRIQRFPRPPLLGGVQRAGHRAPRDADHGGGDRELATGAHGELRHGGLLQDQRAVRGGACGLPGPRERPRRRGHDGAAMKIAILTNAYPYLPGEQFIEDEIGYWAAHDGVEATLLPALAAGTPRPVPAGIAVDLGMARSSKFARLWCVLRALGSTIFRCELGYLRRVRKLKPRTVVRALLHVSKVLEQAAQLQRYADMHGRIDVAYCYWNETQACAALLARKAGPARKVVPRAHGHALYEARRNHAYMPPTPQFVAEYHPILPLSREARDYLRQTYGAPPENIRICPLGVPLAATLSRPSPAGCLHVVSVSSCVQVKRLDRIVDALELLARRHPDVCVGWTHIGAGPLLEEI